MMTWARKWQPTHIIHLGDFLDCYSISDHDKDPRRAHNLLFECKASGKLLDDLDGLGARGKVFCHGNHEHRLERYLMRQAPALLGVSSIGKMLHLRRRGWAQVPYMEHGTIGKLHYTHDAGKCGAGATRAMAMATGASIVYGHTHRLESIYFGSILGDRHIAACAGWLGDPLAAKYKSTIEKAPWQHGFAAAYMNPGDGTFRLDLLPIVDGKVLGP
jgi:hypothetical protein